MSSKVANVSKICHALDLNVKQCETLAEMLPEACPPCAARKPPENGRHVKSRWQECIGERRKGKPFDPAAIRELAKEYRAGRCP